MADSLIMCVKSRKENTIRRPTRGRNRKERNVEIEQSSSLELAMKSRENVEDYSLRRRKIGSNFFQAVISNVQTKKHLSNGTTRAYRKHEELSFRGI